MMAEVKAKALGTEKVVWDMGAFYAGPEDGSVQEDLEALLALMRRFEGDFRGQLDRKLGNALRVYQDISRRMTKLYGYFDLSICQNAADATVRKVGSRVQEALAAAQAKHMTFFDLEVAQMADEVFEGQMADTVVKHHAPMLRHIRALRSYHLPEEVEGALALRAPFGSGEWADMISEIETQLRFTFEGKALMLPEILHEVADNRDAEKRAEALRILNEGLVAQKLTFFAARALNVVAGAQLADHAERGYAHPMAAMNLYNRADDETVKALHQAVEGQGREYARRYYKLKAKLLGRDTLRWSDRNAPMPFAPKAEYSWEQACKIVRKGYGDFSPTLVKLVDQVLDVKNGWVDAPPCAGKRGGAFDATMVLPDGVRSYMLLNYQGGVDDVMTLAHELGHAVHGLLAAEAQGPLMWEAPLAYAETASIFGEMLVFEGLMPTLTEKKERLALYMSKMTDFFNTLLRQISFSTFEQEVFARRKAGKLAVEDFDGIWQETTVRFYGAEGEVFTYADTSHLWAYVSHFVSTPFYVYAYAFGELFVHSLMATREVLGERFEPLYLELLRAGSTQDAVELLRPFGLDPKKADFWENGMEKSVGKWLTEAEKLVGELGL